MYCLDGGELLHLLDSGDRDELESNTETMTWTD